MRSIFTFLFFGIISGLSAQKGLPAPVATTATVNTFFPQHEDFNESMVSRLKVPAGYQLTIAASGLGKPRMMAIFNDHALFITRPDVGDVLLLNDTDGDGKYDDLRTIVSQFSGVHGILIRNEWLYLCSSKKLIRGKLSPDGSMGKADTLINDLPDGGQHPNRTIAFGPDNKLYISVGSDCNDCKESNPEHATMLQCNEDGSGRIVFARGLRNTIGFDWHPATNEMWGIDNGGDWRGEDWPPEELNMIVKDKNYGWPLVYSKQVPDETREDPPGSTKAAYAKTTEPSVLDFPAHAAPIDFKFFRAGPMAGDALICWHGSWNRKNPAGFKVQHIKYSKNGKPGDAKDFLSGFLSDDKKSRFGRPAGIAIASGGSILISDDANGIIYRIKPSN